MTTAPSKGWLSHRSSHAKVTLDGEKTAITTIKLITKGDLPNIGNSTFLEIAEATKKSARGGTRTPTLLPTYAPETHASTNSATRAG